MLTCDNLMVNNNQLGLLIDYIIDWVKSQINQWFMDYNGAIIS